MQVTEADIPVHQYMSPLLTKKCKQADKVRALCYNGCAQEIAVISLNNFIHCWNAVTMKQVEMFKFFYFLIHDVFFHWI